MLSNMQKNLSKTQQIIGALAVIVTGLLAFAFFHSGSSDSSTQVKATTTSDVPAPPKTVAWDGNPNHADCSPEGHPDPKHAGQRISDEGGDEPCVPNAPIPPTSPTVRSLAEQKGNAQDWKKFNEVTQRPRWINAPDTTAGDLDEYYELPGEDGQNACAEVTHSALGDNAYTVSVLNAKHDVRLSTQHMAELAAVSVCGNGRHP
jgi:hypothetical protein